MKKSLLWLLILLLSVSMITTFSLAGGEEEVSEIPAEFQCDVNWRQFEGQEIKVFLSVHPWAIQIEPFIPEFEELTGMKVHLTKMPDAQTQTKVPAELASGTFSYDVFMGRFFDAPKFTLEKWTAPLDEYLNDPNLTDKNWYDLSDFFDSALMITEWGEYRDRLPITAEAYMLTYRKDIYEELGLEVPETFDELKETVKKISESDINAYGITLRGGTGFWYPFYAILRSYGGDYWTEDGEILVNSPESISAFETLVELAKYCPPGVTDYDWDQVNISMYTGQAATFIDSSVAYSNFIDPEKSMIVDKLGFAPYPIGSSGRKTVGHYWSICMNNASKMKPQAWLFLEWATSNPVQQKLSLKGVMPPRKSIWDDPEFVSNYPEDYIEGLSVSLDTAISLTPGRHTLYIWELMDILTAEIQLVMMGRKDVEAAVNNCADRWSEVINQ